MTTRRIGGAHRAFALFTLLAALAFAPGARAADPDTPSDGATGWKKVLAYGRCAFGVFRAFTPTDWGVAFFECARAYMDEPPIPGGTP